MSTRFRSAAAVLGALALLAASPADAEIIEQILVKVNGEIFTKTDLEARQVAALRQKNLQGEPTDEQLKRELAEITPQIMVDAVTEMLLVQRAKELGYRLTDDQFKQAVDNIRKEYKLDTEEKFQAALKQEGMTMSDLRRQFERQMLVQRVEQVEIFGKIAVSEDEARRYYQEHQAEFTTPTSVTLREILVAVPAAATPDQDQALKAKAEQLRERAASGEDYVKLAEQGSDAPSRANGGLIGPIDLTDLSPDLRKVVEGLTAGGISPVVRTSRGYQIFKVETLTPARTLPFEQAREQINDRVFTSKRKEEFDKYIARLKAQAIIEWKNQDVKKAYEDGLAAQAQAAAK